MKAKILKVIIQTVAIVILIICGLLFAQSFYMQRELVVRSRNSGNTVKGISEDAMRDQMRRYLEETAQMRAMINDNNLLTFKNSVITITEAVNDLYVHPDRYGKDEPDHYNASDMGTLVAYVAYGDNVDVKNRTILKETALLSNLKNVLRAVNAANTSVVADYYATESGIFVCSEPVSKYNLPASGDPLYFEARQRPWYTEAKNVGAPVFTGMMLDADTNEYAISCAAPVYDEGVLKGVAGAGMFLKDMREDVDSFRIGENGFACVVNNYGQILFSGAKEGELTESYDQSQDIRTCGNTELSELAVSALKGENGVRLIHIDGAGYYVAYAPMETVSWSYLTVLPEEEVLAPTQELITELDSSYESQNQLVRKSIINSGLVMLIFIVILCIAVYYIASKFADRLSRPVVTLTQKVSAMEGDNLGFEWDIDTGDEVQVLAETFGSMTDRMKQYIDDITRIAGERERLEAELTLAAQIQAAMLPSSFPAYPERKEFDLYATMDPAKEVGGDFYDYFFLDNDHLVIVIADVAGKGAPAALFMVVAMTIIENTTNSIGEVSQVFGITNNQLCEGNTEDMFVTAWIGIVDLTTGVMTWCDAGHENPYIVHNDGQIDELKPRKKKPPMAAIENTSYLTGITTLQPGDCLYLYTDGVVEACNTNEELYKTSRLKALLGSCGEDDPETILKKVREDVDAFVGDAPQFDDMTMLAFKYFGKQE